MGIELSRRRNVLSNAMRSKPLSFFLWGTDGAAENQGAREVETLAVIAQYIKSESHPWKHS